MTESVEQAALRRARETNDWRSRAEREAAAFLDGVDYRHWPILPVHRDTLLAMLAAMWLQGVNLGCHETLAHVETTFDRMRADL